MIEARSSSASARERLVWADAAKAFCIVLVVLQHVVQFTDGVTGWGTNESIVHAWQTVSRFFLPLRMPLFFALSGYFASKNLTSRSWRDSFRITVLPRYYLYAAWTTCGALFYLFGPASAEAERLGAPEYFVHDLWDYALASVVGFTGTWYLYALAVYFVITKVLAPWRARGIWGLTVVLSLVGLCLPARGSAAPFIANLPFFALGALHPVVIERLAAMRATKVIFGGVFAFVVIGLAALTPSMAFPGVRILLGLACVVTAIPVLAHLAERFPSAAALGAWLGTKTLEIYVLHLLLRNIIVGTFMSQLNTKGWPPSVHLVFEALYPLVMTTGLVLLSIWLRRIMERCGFGRLFIPPGSHAKCGRG